MMQKTQISAQRSLSEMLNITHQTLHFFPPSFLDHQKTPPDPSETQSCAGISPDGGAQFLVGSCGTDSSPFCMKVRRKTMYDKKNNIPLNENVCFIHKGIDPTDKAGVGGKAGDWLATKMSSRCFLFPLI